MSTPVIQVINMFVEQNISAVPIVDDNGVVLNVYETIDVMVRKLDFKHWTVIVTIVCVCVEHC